MTTETEAQVVADDASAVRDQRDDGGPEGDTQAPTLFDPSMKKKKKKKAKPDTAAAAGVTGTDEGAAEAVTDGVERMGLGDGAEGAVRGDDDGGQASAGNLDAADIQPLDFGKKKKKKKVVDFGDEEDIGGADTSEFTDAERIDNAVQPWDGSDRDYTYHELCQRAFEFLHGKNPALSTGSRKKLTLRAPQVAKEGSKKTVFLNFGEICKSLHRQPEHLLAYLSAELGTTGNLQAGGRLVIKGNFKPKGIENVLRKYIQEYVTCRSCRSPDTVLMRDPNTRLYFLQCESCGATRSVAPIRQGYVAQVERRKKK